MIPNSHLVKCKSHDQNAENNVQVILRWAIFDVLGFYPMNNHTNTTLRNIEYEKYNSETLSEIGYKLMDAGSTINVLTLCTSSRCPMPVKLTDRTPNVMPITIVGPAWENFDVRMTFDSISL